MNIIHISAPRLEQNNTQS